MENPHGELNGLSDMKAMSSHTGQTLLCAGQTSISGKCCASDNQLMAKMVVSRYRYCASFKKCLVLSAPLAAIARQFRARSRPDCRWPSHLSRLLLTRVLDR